MAFELLPLKPEQHTITFVPKLSLELPFFNLSFRHKDIPIWPHAVGALAVLGTVTWTAVALCKRFGASRELRKARILLHAIFGTQFLLGLLAFWSRWTTADAPQPMAVVVWLTVIHTVVGAILFAFSVLVVLMCYRLVPRSGEVAEAAPQVTTG